MSQHRNGRSPGAGRPAPTQNREDQRKTALAIANIKTLWAQEFKIEQIRAMVPCHVDSSGWAESSIRKICEGIPTNIDLWMAAQSKEGGFDRLNDIGG